MIASYWSKAIWVTSFKTQSWGKYLLVFSRFLKTLEQLNLRVSLPITSRFELIKTRNDSFSSCPPFFVSTAFRLCSYQLHFHIWDKAKKILFDEVKCRLFNTMQNSFQRKEDLLQDVRWDELNQKYDVKLYASMCVLSPMVSTKWILGNDSICEPKHKLCRWQLHLSAF